METLPTRPTGRAAQFRYSSWPVPLRSSCCQKGARRWWLPAIQPLPWLWICCGSAIPGVPVIGIEPALKPAVMEHDHPNVLVMATEMTLKEEKFRRQMESFSHLARIYRLPAPGIVECVERGEVDGPALDGYLREIFRPYREIRLDAVVLGCTHSRLSVRPSCAASGSR